MEHGKPDLAISPEGLKLLRAQRWPGNVRQLENFVERLVVLSEGRIIGADEIERELVARPRFTTQSTGSTGEDPAGSRQDESAQLDSAVRNAEKAALLKALERTGGNRSVAARILGVSRATLYNKLKELGISAQ